MVLAATLLLIGALSSPLLLYIKPQLTANDLDVAPGVASSPAFCQALAPSGCSGILAPGCVVSSTQPASCISICEDLSVDTCTQTAFCGVKVINTDKVCRYTGVEGTTAIWGPYSSCQWSDALDTTCKGLIDTKGTGSCGEALNTIRVLTTLAVGASFLATLCAALKGSKLRLVALIAAAAAALFTLISLCVTAVLRDSTCKVEFNTPNKTPTLFVGWYMILVAMLLCGGAGLLLGLAKKT